MSGQRAVSRSEVAGELIVTAMIWFVPALLLLPVVLALVAISIAASDGSLLEIGTGIRGKIVTALGPLLIVSGAAVLVAAAVLGAGWEEWLGTGLFALVAVIGGGYAIRHAYRQIERELRR